MSWVKSWIYEGESKVQEEQVVEQDRANSLSADSKSSKSWKPDEHICLADRLNKGSGKWLADESFWWCIISPIHAQTKSSKTEESDDKGSGALVTRVSPPERNNGVLCLLGTHVWGGYVPTVRFMFHSYTPRQSYGCSCNKDFQVMRMFQINIFTLHMHHTVT